MSEEGYKPSAEEIEKAEGMMDFDQKEESKSREEEVNLKAEIVRIKAEHPEVLETYTEETLEQALRRAEELKKKIKSGDFEAERIKEKRPYDLEGNYNYRGQRIVQNYEDSFDGNDGFRKYSKELKELYDNDDTTFGDIKRFNLSIIQHVREHLLKELNEINSTLHKPLFE